ncbi:NADAR domain-containing protein [Tautonia plasticadhaerens]|uniref:Swarming motility protein YbiA n=1 Tax=Tautonia plasticadhaerens TaxID=2527974 RepID=A0A518H4B4_9BACT|nr:NADAR domain-containing protein [Tautonia plasticadhaerens]QDV35658.1 Swarming motility protein YbiA [Tautonia plasticadhaerens]
MDVIRFYSVSGEYGCFSNFLPHPPRLKGKTWPTSEHDFQAQKFVGTPDEEEVRSAKLPMVAARMGRSRKRPLRKDWESVKDSLMHEAVLSKFTQHADLREALLGTGEAEIVEHTANDTYWGDGDGSGKNRLGRILMQVREELRRWSPDPHPASMHSAGISSLYVRGVTVLEYLEATAIVDWDNQEVLALARSLAGGRGDPVAVAGRCFEWVRDEIRHSGDHRLGPVTCSASEVLRHGTGFCYAKSHLLAALLRANAIPAGFCYQRLSIDGAGLPFCLHGLNAVYLPGIGWYRIDARGDRPGISTGLDPPSERLAFTPRVEGEATFDEIWSSPLPVVVEALTGHGSYAELLDHLPDLEP